MTLFAEKRWYLSRKNCWEMTLFAEFLEKPCFEKTEILLPFPSYAYAKRGWGIGNWLVVYWTSFFWSNFFWTSFLSVIEPVVSCFFCISCLSVIVTVSFCFFLKQFFISYWTSCFLFKNFQNLRVSGAAPVRAKPHEPCIWNICIWRNEIGNTLERNKEHLIFFRTK